MTALALTLTTFASLLIAPAASADEPVDRGNERLHVLTLWRLGGLAVKAAAAAALVGTDADVKAFLDSGDYQHAAEGDDRAWVTEMIDSGGYSVKAAAQQALDANTPTSISQFLKTGWTASQAQDLRIGVNRVMAVGGQNVRAKAQEALDAGSEESLREFLDNGWRPPEMLDQRIKVNQLMAVGGSKVRQKAQEALDASTLDAYQSFLDFDWPIAQARDHETATVAELADVAKVAGDLATQETQAAKDAADKAVAEAALAKEAAEKAARATESAKNNAAEAAVAATAAADAANRAANAAGEAVNAANAASNASRTAASAASRAASAAAAAGEAASRAHSAAAAAITDRNQVPAARDAAVAARDVAKGAERAADAAKAAGDAARNAGAAAASASSAGQNAADAAQAALDAGGFAEQAGADAQLARSAAANARTQANRATRAANSAAEFANAAANAADRARNAAIRAARDATAAADAAQEAADHAVEADKQAGEASRHASNATAAAQVAIDASNDALAIFDAARKVDTETLAIRADQAGEAARAAKTSVTQVVASRKWDADQASLRDSETTRLITEATAPNADPGLVVSNGRKVALRLADVVNPWTKEAASAALVGTDVEVREYVRNGIAKAAARDDRLTVTSVAKAGSQKLKDATAAALAGSDADVQRFLRDPSYPGRDTEDRIKVNNLLAAARGENRTTTAKAAQKALDANTGAAYRTFLDNDQYAAAVTDDRIAVNRIVADPTSGPETKAMGGAVLDGPPAAIKKWLDTGRFISTRRDADTGAHLAEVSSLLSKASSSAATAVKNANEAQAVAATARGAAQEAAGYAEEARKKAEEATGYAEQARGSALAAERSAQQAATSARTAKDAAGRANESARQATQSANWAQASAGQARTFANDAMTSAKTAFDAAVAAGQDAQTAIDASNAAYDIATQKINDEIVLQAQLQADYCVFRHAEGSASFTNCINVITQTNDEKTARAFENGPTCDFLYGQQRGSAYYQNCIADALNPEFEANRNLELAMVGMSVLTAVLAGAALTGGIAALTSCAVTVVCSGLLLSIAPDGMAFFPGWVASAVGGSMFSVAGVRIIAEMNIAAAEARIVRSTLSRMAIESAELWEIQRLRTLGVDLVPGNVGKFKPDEANMAAWLENRLGVRLMRYAGPFQQGKKSPDWYDFNGITYDSYGPLPTQYFQLNWDKGVTQKGLLAHLEKADIVPVDITGLTPGQTKLISDFIAPYGPRMFMVII